MEKVKTVSVRNMSKYQHYKRNRPPWMKLYNSLFHEREFCRLKDASKAHLIGIFSLASHNNNIVPYDPEWIASQIGAKEPLDWQELEESGFLVFSE